MKYSNALRGAFTLLRSGMTKFIKFVSFFSLVGVMDIETKEWITQAPFYWSYKEAIKIGMKTPSDIDNFAFHGIYKY